ncbi:MAG: fatty acid desaturase, partial [Deltaproteobacteria bacterium]|nr:fatty acid desaturase [Deltaproteobacteria bacterium]
MSEVTTRTGKELLEATRAFSQESVAKSWLHVLSTLLVWGALSTVLVSPAHWALKVPVAFIAGLTVVRMFVLYHDHLHGSFLRSSLPARAFFAVFG